ncbi:MFS transporter [Vibrio sp. E150_011]
MLLLLAIIYLAFISLGLPDAVLGSSWPVMSQDLNSTLEFAGIISLIISAGTVCSSLMATRLIHRFGTGKVVAFSVLMTACALLGFTFVHHALALVILAVPLGIGAGAVDAALNNFVALHYKSKHMNYLHSFWGVGATAGPLIMATYLSLNNGWREGYTTIAMIQFVLVIVLFSTLPLWKKAMSMTQLNRAESSESLDDHSLITNRQAVNIDGVKLQLLLFFCYCALEAGTGLWAASYLAIDKGMSPADAAFWTAMYYLGITAGRFVCGMLADHVKEESLIRGGLIMIMVGVVGLIVPIPDVMTPMSLIVIGVGCAPIYPNTIHLTPKRFGKRASQAIISLTMATAYVGTTVVPPVIGAVVATFSFTYFPGILLALSITMFVMSERLVKRSHCQERCSSTTSSEW